MTQRTLQVFLLAGLVLLAGCVGGISDSPASPTTDESGVATTNEDQPSATETTQPSTTDADGADGSSSAGDAGTVSFYISDEKNAIEDFRNLNVTVTGVGFERAAANGGGWVEREVDDQTVDLTKLQGANATLIDEYAIPNGTYGKVFIHVGAVNATLRNGEHVRVKLPSEKLQLEEGFTVANGSSVNFVFDITVHEAGNSGKYVLKPVISESGTDVPIDPTDDREDDEGDDERDDHENAESNETLNATFLGNVSQGENATLRVTRNDTAVENATVAVDGETAGTTDADGEFTFEVPDEETLTVTIEAGDAEVELEREFGSD